MKENIVPHPHHITKADRAAIKTQRPCILWFTGLSGSGKSTIANAVEQELWRMGRHTYLLDGDNIRSGLNSDLGFDEKSRQENIRRIGEVAKLFVDSGLIVLTAFISPYRNDRESVRRLVEEGEFIEIFVDAPLEVCESRDPKGLYKKAREGAIEHFTGISSPYEPPMKPEIHIKNDKIPMQTSVSQIIEFLEKHRYI